ncbi:MAG: SusD/RagB family nutrient-binding outer membrane lipoprotein [Saprospiraceae bacterium]
MKNILKYSLLILACIGFNSCQNFDELSENPNNPVQVPASLVFTKVCSDLNENPWSGAHQYAQYWCINYEYYGNQNYNWTSTGLNYGTINDILKMEEEAIRGGADAKLNPYAALGKFFRAYFYVNMSQRVGDLPLSEAFKIDQKILTPKYDSQKDIFVQALKWLDESNNDLASLIAAGDRTLSGDIYFGNDLSKWQRAVNAYRLRVLISLSKRESEVDIKSQFAQILGNSTKYPLFTGNGDNLAFTYNNVVNKYPTNPDNFGFNATRYNMAETYIKTLTDLKDPRVFLVAEPADSMLRTGLKPSDFGAYLGAPSGESLADMSYKATLDLYSYINRSRYYSNYTAEKNIMIGYIEQCFNIAEGLNRGWASGDAADYHQKGIKASMEFYDLKSGLNTFYYLPRGKKLGEYASFQVDVNVDNYLNQASVKYKGNNVDGLNQILTQKYLGFFQHSGWEAFYNQRRTGIPVFNVGPGNTNGQRIPQRWQYPNSERTVNTKNWEDALAKQFGNKNDDINSALWIVK